MAQPYVRVRVDLQRGTDYETDISADVMECKLTRGMEVDKWRIPATALELKVKNADHKYTPTAAASIFFGLTPPGYPIKVDLAYPADFFATTAANFSGRSPTYDSKFTWAGDVTLFEVAAARAKPLSNGSRVVYLEFEEKNCWLYLRMDGAVTGTASGLVFRYTDNSNYWLLRQSAVGTVTLTKYVAAVATNVDTFSGDLHAGTGYHVRLHGDSIRVYDANVMVADTVDSFNNTATKHGIGGYSVNTADKFYTFGGFAPVFTGLLDTVIPRPEPDKKHAYLRAFDSFEQMARAALNYNNASGSTWLIGALIDDIVLKNMAGPLVGSAYGCRILDGGDFGFEDTDTQKTFGTTILGALYQLQDDGGHGRVYVDGMGGLNYESAIHRTTTPHDVTLKEWAYQPGTESTVFMDAKSFQWDNGFDRVENLIHFGYKKISRATTVEVWRLRSSGAAAGVSDIPFIAAAATAYFAVVGDGDGIGNPTTPVATTDYVMNELANGTGVNRTANFTVSIVETNVMLGNRRLIKVVNNHATESAFVTLLKLRADRITDSLQTYVRVEDTTSQTNYGVRFAEHQAVAHDTWADALTAAQQRLLYRKDPHPRIVCVLSNGSRANVMQQAHRMFGDRVTPTFTPFGTIGDCFIEKQVLTVTDGGLKCESEFTLTKV